MTKITIDRLPSTDRLDSVWTSVEAFDESDVDCAAAKGNSTLSRWHSSSTITRMVPTRTRSNRVRKLRTPVAINAIYSMAIILHWELTVAECTGMNAVASIQHVPLASTATPTAATATPASATAASAATEPGAATASTAVVPAALTSRGSHNRDDESDGDNAAKE